MHITGITAQSNYKFICILFHKVFGMSSGDTPDFFSLYPHFCSSLYLWKYFSPVYAIHLIIKMFFFFYFFSLFLNSVDAMTLILKYSLWEKPVICIKNILPLCVLSLSLTSEKLSGHVLVEGESTILHYFSLVSWREFEVHLKSDSHSFITRSVVSLCYWWLPFTF